MKECSFCGMPLHAEIEGELCDFCRNDDGKEMLAGPEDFDSDELVSSEWGEE